MSTDPHDSTAMFTVRVTTSFDADHALTVPDAGPEGDRHTHRYEATVELVGPDLDGHGYLVDIDDAEAALEDAVDRYRGEMLNDLPEFAGRNPSAERLARALLDRVLDRIDPDGLDTARVRVDEDATAGVTYRRAV